MDDLFKKTITYEMICSNHNAIGDEQKVYFEGEYIGSILWSTQYWNHNVLGHESPLDECVFRTFHKKYEMDNHENNYKKIINHLNQIAEL